MRVVTLVLALVASAAVAAALPSPLPLAGRVVALDPGHGGSDSGSRDYYAVNGLPCPWVECPDEKDLNLRVARVAAALLEARGADVVLTRTEDVTVTVAERVRIANDARADVFVSVHHNAGGGRGTETFYWGSGSTFSVNGKRLAGEVQSEVVATLGTHDRGIKADKDALGYHLYVLRYTTMPAALVEVAFLDHQADYDKMVLPTNQALAAAAVADGVDDYFG